MLLPDDVGDFRCESCDFVTSSLFDLMEHHGVEYSWNVMLSKKYSFNLFSFLSQLNFYLEEELFEEAWEHIQSTALLFLNSSGGPKEFEAFLEEAEIYANMDAVMNQVEEILKETYDDKDKE
jgi:hypothetical protein